MGERSPAKLEKSGIQEFLENLNLPHLLAGNAGKAISRLIGAAADIPAAKLEQITQGIKDNTSARSVVKKAVAQKTAEIAVTDPELLQRAKESFVNDLMRKQENREAVAAIAIKEVGSEEIAKDTRPVDDDWMNVFSAYAEHASSERLQTLWGKVLAGEIRKPGNFSVSTLRFLSELDRQTAESFQVVAGRILDDYIPASEREDEIFLMHLLVVADSGLIANALSSGLKKVIQLDEKKGHIIKSKNKCIYLKNSSIISKFEFDIISVSKIGLELLKIMDFEADVDFMKKFAKSINNDNIEKVCIADFQTQIDGKIKLSDIVEL